MPKKPRTVLNSPCGWVRNVNSTDDRRRAGDRGEEEGRPEERLAADLLVDDHGQDRAQRHLGRDDDGRQEQGVGDRLGDEDRSSSSRSW